MAYWIEINYERKKYFVDLDRISAFSMTPNGRLTFWLPDSAIPIVLNHYNDAEGYRRVLDYVETLKLGSLPGNWVQLFYERQEYLINLDRLSSFCCDNYKLTFWLPDSALPIVLNQQSEPEAYEKIAHFLQKKTGKSIFS